MKKGIIALGLLASLSAYSQESYVPQAGEGIVSVSYTHLTLPTKLEV